VIRWTLGDARDFRAEGKAARDRLSVAKAGLREFEYDLQLGISGQVSTALPGLEEALMITKSMLLAIPGRLAQRLAYEKDPETVRVAVQKEVELAVVPLDDILATWAQKAAQARAAREKKMASASERSAPAKKTTS
jgi:hypothetical protein